MGVKQMESGRQSTELRRYNQNQAYEDWSDMDIKAIEGEFSVCKVEDFSGTDLEAPYCFIGKTDEERSLVCLTSDVPANTLEREDGWRAMRIEGVLDFSLTGILAKISGVLAEAQIGIFAISTYNTDYVLVKRENETAAHEALCAAGYRIVR